MKRFSYFELYYTRAYGLFIYGFQTAQLTITYGRAQVTLLHWRQTFPVVIAEL